MLDLKLRTEAPYSLQGQEMHNTTMHKQLRHNTKRDLPHRILCDILYYVAKCSPSLLKSSTNASTMTSLVVAEDGVATSTAKSVSDRSRSTTIRCSIFQTPNAEFLEDVVVSVECGVIASIEPAREYLESRRRNERDVDRSSLRDANETEISAHESHGAFDGDEENLASRNVCRCRKIDIELPPNTVLIPGFVDLHIHAPQWPQLGTGLDLPLDEWLFKYTFPTEAKCADAKYARNVWDDMVPTLLAHGTTTAVYYSSIHVEATTALAEACIRHGQRAWVGRVAMDHPEGTPDYYRDASASVALEATRQSISEINALDDPHNLVQPIITPRFIPACTDELLTGLGELASETGHLVQTHCSENDWEHEHVIERHNMTDTDSLDRFGLLSEHTVLAHGCMLTDDNFEKLAERGAGIAHCPLSNIYFGDAVFPARLALNKGVSVGLGTDIAGGPSASLMRMPARAVDSSRHLEQGVNRRVRRRCRGVAGSRINVLAAFHMATKGGADVLGAPVGIFARGRRFDAVAVNMEDVDRGRASGVGGDSSAAAAEMRFEKLVRLAGRKDVTHVWVDGVLVKGGGCCS